MDTASGYTSDRGLAVWTMRYEAVVALMAPGEIGDLLDLFRRPAWMAYAACRGERVSAFVPSRRMTGAPPRHLLDLCLSCPVAHHCLEYALEHPKLLGVWGGTTDAQRKALRRFLAA